MWITSMEVQTEQNIEIAPTGDTLLCCGSETLPGAAPFYMYENLSWIHDIHYRWGLPFCTPVTGAEFFHDTHPHHHTATHSFPLVLLITHSFLLPHALPLKRCFIPHQVPFIPLQPFGLLSFHPSISQTLHLYYLPSACPSSLIRPLPHTAGCTSKEHVTSSVEACGDLLRQCHRTLICLLRFFIDFVLNKWKIQEEWGARGDRK